MALADSWWRGKIMERCVMASEGTKHSSQKPDAQACIFERAAVGLCEISLRGRFIRVNDELCRMLDLSREQLLTLSIADVTHPDDLPHSIAAIERLIRAGERVSLDKRYVRPDGTLVIANSALTRLDDEQGNPQAVLAVTVDLTERKRAEEHLARITAETAKQRRLYQAILSSTPDLVFAIDRQHRFTFANDALLTMWGQDAEESIGKTLLELGIEPTRAALHEGEFENVFATKQTVRGEVPFLHTDVGQRVYEYILVPMIGDDGEVEGIAGTTRDVTERKRAEAVMQSDLTDMQHLHALSTRLINEQNLDAVLEEILEAALAVARCDKGTIQLIEGGSSELQLVSQRGFAADSGEQLQTITRSLSFDCAAALQRDERVNVPDITTSPLHPYVVQSFRSVNIRALQCIPLRTRRSELIGVISTFFGAPRELSEREQRVVDLLARQAADVIDRLRTENALRESEHRFRELAEAMPQLVWTARKDGCVEYYNTRIHDYGGFTQLDDGTWEWVAVIHPDDAERTLAAWSHAMATGETYAVEHRVQMADGSMRWHLSRAKPMIIDGEIVKWFGAATDIQDYKAVQEELALHRQNLEKIVNERTAELEQSHKRLAMSERMASIGTLSAGLGHDMGNLLMPVNVHVAALKEADLPPEQRHHIEVIETSARYLQELSKGLRLLSTDPSKGRAGGNISVLSWWASARPILKNVLPGNIELKHDFPETDCRVAISRAALTQAVFNLVQNAGDALSDRGVQNAGDALSDRGVQNAGDALSDRGSGAVTVWLRCIEQEWVTLGVTDNGPGMPDEVKQRCMEAYYSTKSRGLSTGMGLALVRGLIGEVGGKVELESTLGEGTTFRLIIPSAPARPSASKKRSKNVLVDTSDPQLKAIIARDMETRGFNVLSHVEPNRKLAMIVVDEQTLSQHADAGYASNTRLLIVGESSQAAAADDETVSRSRTVHIGSAQKLGELRARLRQLATATSKAPR